MELVWWWLTLGRLWPGRIFEYWQLKLNPNPAVLDTRALMLGERGGEGPCHELSGLQSVQSPPSIRPLRQLVYSRLRLRVLCSQMSLLDESTRRHRNTRHAGVHYKHIP